MRPVQTPSRRVNFVTPAKLIPFRANLRVRVVVADRAEVAVKHSLVRAGAGEHLFLAELPSLIEWRNGVLRRENRVQIVERRVRDELDSRVQERCAVRARIGGNPLVVDADPRLGVPALPEVRRSPST